MNNIIYRKRLMEFVENMTDGRVLYVEAPAGYGKSVFGEQWLKKQDSPKAMIVLDEYDNTVGDFCFKLKQLLIDLCKGKDKDRVLCYIEDPDFDKAPVEFMMRAESAMESENTGSIVIDDLHCITDKEVQKVLYMFLKRLPKGINTCILSRNVPPESLSEMVLKNELQFVTSKQMLFDSEEITDLYKNKDIRITKGQVESILDFTEGWPIGISALLLSKDKIPVGSMPKEWLESFLRSHVWSRWDERSREFMLATCMEDELREELCNVLTGESDSGILLEQLTAQGAFLSRQYDGSYRFHRLFREFLRKMLLEKPEEYRIKQICTAGEWYQERNEFYRAVARYAYIKDYEKIEECFASLEKVDRAEFDAEQVMKAVHMALDKEMTDKYPSLYFMLAFTARNEGRIEDFKHYADEYYRHYPQIAEHDPETAHNIFFLYAMDVRMTLAQMLTKAEDTQTAGNFQGVRGSATLYFPLYHRSYRDFSELLPGDFDSKTDMLGNILGPLLGEECPMLMESVKAGLYYEKGQLQHALELALAAASKVRENFAPESKFCVMMLLLMINHALGQNEEEERVRENIEKMIENDKAFYLQYNFDAVLLRNRMESGDTEAAQLWLKDRESGIYDQLDFFRLYGHFATAEAYIILGYYGRAIILLEKIVKLCESLNRPIDVIEANILLAVAFRKKQPGNHRKALEYLERAISIAQTFGYEQAFINEGRELEKILSTLKNWTMRGDYEGKLSETFIRKIYIGAAERARYCKNVTGGKEEKSINLTSQQKRVAQLMCEGYSYRKIGEELNIRFSTVRSHIEAIYRKLDVSEMKEAILKIRTLHILE